MYKEGKIPKKFGILFTESSALMGETVWYESEEERDMVVSVILDIGGFHISTPHSPVERYVRVYAFNAVNAADVYYKVQVGE